MYRGKVTKVDAKGVYVQTADFGTIGPCQVVGATPDVDDMVLAANVGTDVAPDLVVLSVAPRHVHRQHGSPVRRHGRGAANVGRDDRRR